MHVELNSRGNGACPICVSTGKCRIQDSLIEKLKTFITEDDLMELVIYSCPHFKEK
ncbi:MAG: hypothetical protein LBH16_10025 [Treponema sp.]|nr:hypothetical protein [Treponema sp.]